jgi:Holliday junction resolvasome RuvABC ATP-dependent DNA helicase subunit
LEIAKYGLTALNVDMYGLDEMDNKILHPSYINLRRTGRHFNHCNSRGEDAGTGKEVL